MNLNTMAFIFLEFIIREVGTSYNFTCPDQDSSKNHTYKFYTGFKKIIPGGRFKQYGNILTITDLRYQDSSQYFCSIYDLNGKSIKNRKSLAILTIKPGNCM